MKRKKIALVSLGSFLALVFLLFLHSPSLPALSFEQSYTFGERIKIDLTAYDSYSLRIESPTGQNIKNGAADSLLYKPTSLGTHTLVVTSGDSIERYTFEVIYPSPQGLLPVVDDSSPGELFVIPKASINAKKKQFASDEKPSVTLELDTASPGFAGNAQVKLKNAYGVVVDSPATLVLDATTLDQEVTFDLPRQFTPGKYTVEVLIEEEDGDSYLVEDTFDWGVLAVNTDQATYAVGQEVDMHFGVLDDFGRVVCTADLTVKVTEPNGDTVQLSTDDNTIVQSEECRFHGYSLIPDFSTSFTVNQEGTYTYEVVATTHNGPRIVQDSFKVVTTAPYFVQRIGPTRLYPVNPYEMQFIVTAQEEYSGPFIETVPGTFEIITSSDGSVVSTDPTTGDQLITWNVDFEAGTTYTLSYVFDAPDVSPEFYLLGPARFGDFVEGRQWQLANDVVFTGEFYLFFNDTVAPTGWTCVSCLSTDDFYNRFVRGAATYGAQGGLSGHVHTLGWVSETFGTTQQGSSGNPAAVTSLNTHTHGALASTSVSNESLLPQHETLTVIRYDGVGIPSIIPAGAIALFNTTSLPTDWTRYSALDGDFVYTNNSVGVASGSNTHEHAVATGLAASPDTTTGRGGGSQVGTATDGHTHLQGPSSTSSTVDHRPPYREVVFARADSDVVLPYANFETTGMIAMLNATPPAGWDHISDSGSDLFERFIVGAATYGVTNGTTAHAHPNLAVTTGAPDATEAIRNGAGVQSSTSTHTHIVTVNFTNETHLPPYLNVIFAFAQSDFEPPNITLLDPQDGLATSNPTITFNATVADNVAVTNVSLFGNWTGSYIRNETNLSALNDAVYAFTKTLPDGGFVWAIEACDLSGNCNITSNRTITIDATPPVITTLSPETKNYSQSFIDFNISLSEAGSLAWYTLDDGITNISMSSSDTTTWNATNTSIGDGGYTVTFYANDTAGNAGTDSISFGIDTITPLVTLVHPQSINYISNQLSINFTASDLTLQSCWYTLNDGVTNITLANCANTTFTAAQGTTTLQIFANDSANNVNGTESATFFVDSIPPLISYGSQTRPNGTSWENNWIYIDVSVTETNFANITYELFNETDGGTLVNRSVFTTEVYVLNFTGLNNNLIDYYYNVTVLDTLGNVNYTETRTLTLTPGDIQGPVITFITPPSNEYFYNTQNPIFNISLDEVASFVFYSLDFGITNNSMSNLTTTIWNATNTGTADGEYELTIFTEDTLGNPSSAYRNFTVDTITPFVDYGFGTESDGANLSRTNAYVNISVTELHEANVTFRLHASAGVYNVTTLAAGSWTFNWTTLPDDVYTYNVTVTDLANNQNTTQTRSVIIDTTVPLIAFGAGTETDGAGLARDNIYVNITLVELYEANVTFSLYNSTGAYNVTTLPAGSRTFNWTALPDGIYSFNVTSADYAGNQNTTLTRSVIVDGTPPQIEYGLGTEIDGTNISRNNLYVNVTITELNEANVTFTLYNSTAVYNVTTLPAGSRTFNWTALPDDTYMFNVTITDETGTTNTTSTRTVRTDTTDPAINVYSDDPDPVVRHTNLNLTVNVTDNFSNGVASVWTSINATNYSLSIVSGNLYRLFYNTTNLTFTNIYGYTLYANDSAGNLATPQTGTFKVVQELTPPVINEINDTPDPVSFGFAFNITANVTDNANVSEVIVDLDGTNYTMSLQSGNVYNATIDSLDVGIGTFNYTVYATDTSDNAATPQTGNITIVEGTFVVGISVRAANPDPIDRDREGRYAVIFYNPTDSDVIVSTVYINATNAVGGVFGGVLQADLTEAYPAGGWALTSSQLVTWSGTEVVPAQSITGFYVTIDSGGQSETFDVGYSAVLTNGSRFDDPHTHSTTQFASNNPFTALAMEEQDATYPSYNTTVKGGTARTYSISLEESTNRGPIPTGVELTVESPDGFTNMVPIGGTGWNTGSVTDGVLTVTTTQAVQNGRITYDFNMTAPSGTAAQGTYVLNAFMTGTNARAGFEGGIEVFDGEPPEIILVDPFDGQNLTNFTITPFSYNVSDSSALTSCVLFGDWSGSFVSEQTDGAPTNNAQNNFSEEIVTSDGFYSWNVQCTDAFNNIGVAEANFSFGAFLYPNATVGLNATQDANDGTGNVTLYWEPISNALSYEVYSTNDLTQGFSLLNTTTNPNYTDTTFSGSTRRFYRVDAINPTGQNISGDLFGAHVYTLRHNGNTRNLLGFPTNATYLRTANDTLNEVRNATAISAFNETIQRRETCNAFSCPSFPSCTPTNCDFNFNTRGGRAYEVYVNSSAPSAITWSIVGIVYTPQTIGLVKNTTDFGKNWVSMYANTTIAGAAELFTNITNADAVSRWDSTAQTSEGLIPSPFPFGPTYIGTNFSLVLEDGYEVSVTANQDWLQI